MTSHIPSKEFLEMLPKLDGSNHKGQHGKIAVIGGSVAFTGAPFYSAFAAMLAGADYGNVFCTTGAATAIKSFAPELIVHPCMREQHGVEGMTKPDKEVSAEELANAAMEDLSFWLAKSSCVVVGPGLGTDPAMVLTAQRAIHAAREKNLPVVIDADGLGAVGSDLATIKGYSRAILTPNTPELWRLLDALGVEHSKPSASNSPELLQEVAKKLDGPTVLAKGSKDTVCSAAALEPMSTTGTGSPRRCGGQGDILSGLLAAVATWTVSYAEKQGIEDEAEVSRLLQTAAVHASEVARLAQQIAFERRGRSMVARDVLDSVHAAVEQLWPHQA